MRELKVGILGATGAVGREMLKVLSERDFPAGELRLFAGRKSAGQTVTAFGKTFTVKETDPALFSGLDLLLGAAENDVAKRYLPLAASLGVQVVDNSSAFRLREDVPLVIPEVNPEDVKRSNGIIANPNCATIIALTAVAALHKKAHIKRMIVSTYQAVSGAGKAGIDALLNETREALSAGGHEDRAAREKTSHAVSPADKVFRALQPENGGTGAQGAAEAAPVFPYPIAFNLIPQIGGFNELGYSSEEMKLQNEGRKILHKPELLVNCTCVRVPVLRSHSESITLEFADEISPKEAKELLSEAEGVRLYDDPDTKKYPMPLLTSDQDLVYVGRVRRDLSAPPKLASRTLSLFCCADQLRKGAATNAVQIAEKLFSL